MSKPLMIGGIPFALSYSDNMERDEGVCLGETIHSECTITLKKDMPSELERVTLIHEMLHAMFVLIGRNDLSDDEQLVQSLALCIQNTPSWKIDTSEGVVHE